MEKPTPRSRTILHLSHSTFPSLLLHTGKEAPITFSSIHQTLTGTISVWTLSLSLTIASIKELGTCFQIYEIFRLALPINGVNSTCYLTLTELHCAHQRLPLDPNQIGSSSFNLVVGRSSSARAHYKLTSIRARLILGHFHLRWILDHIRLRSCLHYSIRHSCTSHCECSSYSPFVIKSLQVRLHPWTPWFELVTCPQRREHAPLAIALPLDLVFFCSLIFFYQ